MGYSGENGEVLSPRPLPPGERGRLRGRSETWMIN